MLIKRLLLAFFLPLVAADAAGVREDRDSNAHTEINRSSVAADKKATEPSSDLPTIPLGSKERHPKLTPPPGGRTELETIIVTATKRPSAHDSLPASVGYISGETLESAGASELRDFLTRIPGVQQTEVFPEFNRISIRGVQSDTAAVTSAATGFFIEEVPFSGPFVLHARPDLPPFDLEAVEVLKGPQGTLFGASALAGALRYRVMDAEPGHWGAHGFLQYQSPEDGSANHSVGVAANVPIGNDAAVRVVGASRVAGGRIDDLRNGMSDTDKAHRQSGRVLWRWEPASQRWSLGLKAFVHGVDAHDLPLAETTNGRFERERALRNAPMNSRAKFAAFDAKYRANWADIVLVSSVIDTQSILSGLDGARALAIEDAGQPAATPTREDIQGYVQEVRLVSPSHDSPWEWLVGGYAHQYFDFSTQRVVVEAGIVEQELALLDFVADVQAREFSVFGEFTRRIGPRWSLTSGARLYRIETSGEVVSTGALILATGNIENRNNANINAAGVSPKFAMQYKGSDEFSSYLSVSRGFRFGGIQIIGPSPTAPNVPPTYKSDTIWSYEWGIRSRWLDRRLRLNATVFYIDWKDPQLQTTTGGAVPLNVIDNIGHARSQGAEVELVYRTPIRDLNLSFAAAWTDARSTEPYTAPSGDEARAGARLPGSAREQVVGAVEYGFGWGGNRLELTLSYNYQGAGVNDILQTLSIYDYDATDLRLRFSNSRWLRNAGLTFGINNLFDNRAVIQASETSDNEFTTVYNNSRTAFARLEWSWYGVPRN